MKDLPNALLDKRGLSFDSAGQKTCKRSHHMPKLTNTSVCNLRPFFEVTNVTPLTLHCAFLGVSSVYVCLYQ